MGLDIYTGTLTRYYTHNWKTVTQVWCEKNGYTYNIVGNEDNEDKPSPEETLEITINWQQQILSGLKDVLGEVPAWNEDYEQTSYYTEKPDWDALNALLLYISAKMTDETVPEIVNKNFELYKHPLYKKLVKYSKKYRAHDEKNEAKIGDTVKIAMTRPLSKTKRYELVKVVKEAVIL